MMNHKYAVLFDSIPADKIEVTATDEEEAKKEAVNQWHRLHVPCIEKVVEIQ